MNFVRSCLTIVLVALLSGVGLVACDQGAAPINDRTTAVQPTEQPVEIEIFDEVETIIEEEIALVETEVEEEVLWDSGLIVNGSFEEWERNRPVGWELRADYGHHMQTTNAFQGNFAASLPDVENAFPMLIQRLSADTLRGKEIEFGAMMLADDNGKFAVELRYTFEGEEVRRIRTHPGNSIWMPMNAKIEIPEEIESEYVDFVIFRRPNAEGLTLVDNAFLKIN